MTVQELVKKYPNDDERNDVISKMSRDEIKKVADSFGVVVGKVAFIKKWERLTGNKY